MNTSAKVFTGVVCQATPVWYSRSALPIQRKCVGSNRVRSGETSGWVATSELMPADHRAVTRRHVVEVVGGDQRARARHVLHHDGRVARNMPAQMLGHQPGIAVVAAARGRAGDEPNGLVLVIRRLRRRGLRERDERRQQQDGPW